MQFEDQLCTYEKSRGLVLCFDWRKVAAHNFLVHVSLLCLRTGVTNLGMKCEVVEIAILVQLLILTVVNLEYVTIYSPIYRYINRLPDK